jgi:hypothetical protein
VERCDSKRSDERKSLSGVEQRGLDGARVMIYRCRVEELSGVMAALIVGQSRSVR